MWLAIFAIIAIVLAVAMYFLTPKPSVPTQDPNSLEVPSAKMGAKIPVLFGTRWISDSNVTWWGDVEIAQIKSEGGGKK